MYERRKVSSEIEERIVIGLIVSDDFCREVFEAVDPGIFQSEHIGKIAEWSLGFYKKFLKAPKNNIQHIFGTKKKNLSEANIELISLILQKLSDDYIEEQEGEINVEYLAEETKKYVKKRWLKIIGERAASLSDMDMIDDAEAIIRQYDSSVKPASNIVNVFDEKSINMFFDEEENDNSARELFSFPGDLGRLIGPFERNWLFSILAPMKRGKTWLLQEIAIQAILERKRVCFFSLEMDSFRISKRIYQRISGMAKETGDYVVPVFDCMYNQDGSCDLSERENHIPLLDLNGEKPRFDPKSPYRACSKCRGTERFKPDVWFELSSRNKLKRSRILNLSEGILQTFGDRLRVKSYPAFSANLSVLRGDLHILEKDGFCPDVVIIDYADILAPEDPRVVGRDRIDETWKTLKNMSDSLHILVVTASQSTRASIDKKYVTQTDFAEDIRKLAHVDAAIALNQTSAEKRQGVMRIAKIAGRDTGFDQYANCLILQQLSLGQALIDSEIVREVSDEEFFI